MKSGLLLCLATSLAAALILSASGPKAQSKETAPAKPTSFDTYVVAVEEGAGKDWQNVGDNLAKHRKGKVISFKADDLKALVPQLRELRARYLAMVMRPQTLDANVPRVLVPLLTTIVDDPCEDVA